MLRIWIFNFLFIFFLIPVSSHSQNSDDVWFRKIGLKKGLPNTTVYYFHQDSQGYIWLTTQAGIARYDGHDFETFLIPSDDIIPTANLSDFILEDKNGVIWIGYQENNHIARYDSVRGDFDYLNMQELVNVNGEIQHTRLLGIDVNNNLWAALILKTNYNNPVLIKLNTETQEIKAFMDEEGNSVIENGMIMPRFFASYVNYNAFIANDNGSVWIGTDNGALYISENDEIQIFREDEGLQNSYVHHMLEVDNEIWAATDSGIYIFDTDLERFNPLAGEEELNQQPVYYLYEDSTNALWITANTDVFIYENGNYSSLNAHKDLTDWGTVSMIPQAETEDRIWFVNKLYSRDHYTSTEGFSYFDKTTNRFFTYRNNFDDIGLQNAAGINVLRTDKSGSVWIGTMGSGLFQYPKNFKKFATHFTSQKFQDLLADHFYYRINESPEGHIFTGSSNGKILAKNAFTNEEIIFHEFEQISPNATGTQNLISSIFFPEPGRVLISTEWSGLQRFRYDPKTLEILETKSWIPPQMNSGIPVCLVKDNEENIWIGTSNGVVKADFDNEIFTPLSKNERSGYNPKFHFGDSCKLDENGNLWFYSTRYGGIKRINMETQKVEFFNLSETVPDELVIETVNALEELDNGKIIIAAETLFEFHEDSAMFLPLMDKNIPNVIALEESDAGELVIATYGHGLFWLDTDTNQIVKQINQDNGVGYNTIVGVEKDKFENYWFVNSVGLSRYISQEDVVLNYYAEHGLPGIENHLGYAIRQGKSGVIFPLWASNNGVSSINVNHINRNNYSVKPTITKVVADDLTLPLFDNKTVEVPPGFSNISIYFSALQFDDPENNEYSYSFAGDAWTDWSNEHSIHFNRLNPGTYTLKVKARNPDLIPSKEITSYTFTVLPPWYQSSIAYFSYLIFGLGGLVFGAFRYSKYQTNQTQIKLQAEQAKELAKLDQMKTNLLINISHELRTPLTLVLGPLEQIRKKATVLGDDWVHRLNVAWRNGKRLQQLVEQVLDLTRLDSRRMELKPRIYDLSSFLKRTLESFESMADQHDVSLKTDLPAEEILFKIDPDKFEKIIMNLISNAIKFTPANGSVTLGLKSKPDSIQISVKDTGRGIESERLPFIFDRFHSSSERISGGGHGLGVGLSITKEFVELHKGSISVESVEDSGTTFFINLPNNYNEIDAAEVVIDEKEPAVLPDKTSPAPLKKIGSVNEKSETILVVEDNDDMRTYVAELFDDGLVRVITANNGTQGKKQLSLLKPDLVITDIMMPEMDGYEFAEYIRSVPEHRLTPIIMLSARAEVEDRIKGYDIGISDYLVKPFNEHELRARVNNLLTLKFEREQLSSQTEETEELSADAELVNTLQNYVEKNVQQDEITVEQLSDVAMMSRRQLYRKLKAATGFTPAEFVREIRLNKARFILERKQKQTMAEVAYAVGFSTPSYFSRLYTTRFGRNPAEYLK